MPAPEPVSERLVDFDFVLIQLHFVVQSIVVVAAKMAEREIR